jgi:hypothetical protein
MRDLTGRIERLEKRVSASNEELIVLTVPYSERPEVEQGRALEKVGLTLKEASGRQVLFLTSYAQA